MASIGAPSLRTKTLTLYREPFYGSNPISESVIGLCNDLSISRIILYEIETMLAKEFESSGGTGVAVDFFTLRIPKQPHERYLEFDRNISPTHYKRFRPSDFERPLKSLQESCAHPESLGYRVVLVHAHRALLHACHNGYGGVEKLFTKLGIISLMYDMLCVQERTSIWKKFVCHYSMQLDHCVSAFNSDPRGGLLELLKIDALVNEETDCLNEVGSNQSSTTAPKRESNKFPSLEFQLAFFLISATTVRRRSIAEVLSGSNDFWKSCRRKSEPGAIRIATIKHYGDLLDYSHLGIDQALRFFTRHFPLKGESQHIYEALEAFCTAYISCRLREAHDSFMQWAAESEDAKTHMVFKLEIASLLLDNLVIAGDESASTFPCNSTDKLRRLLRHKRLHSGPCKSQIPGAEDLPSGTLQHVSQKAETFSQCPLEKSVPSTVPSKPNTVMADSSKTRRAIFAAGKNKIGLRRCEPERESILSPRSCPRHSDSLGADNSEKDSENSIDDDDNYIFFKKSKMMLKAHKVQQLEDYILKVAYGIIILHTSKHNPNVLNRSAQLTKQSFRRMITGAADFPIPSNIADSLYNSFSAIPLRDGDCIAPISDRRNHRTLWHLCVRKSTRSPSNSGYSSETKRTP